MKHFDLVVATSVLAVLGGIACAGRVSYRDYCIDGTPTPKAYTIICGRSMDGQTYGVRMGRDEVGFYTFDRDPTQFAIVFQSDDDSVSFNTDIRTIRVSAALNSNCYDYRISAINDDDPYDLGGYITHCKAHNNDLFVIPK